MKSTKSIVTEGTSTENVAPPKKLGDQSNHHNDELTYQDSTLQDTSMPLVKPRGKWTHNPIVLSLIACSTMHNCEEVKEIYRDCIANNDRDSMLCEAAEKYFKMCHMSNGDTNSILDFTPYIEP